VLSRPPSYIDVAGLVRTKHLLLIIVQPPRDTPRTIYMFLCPWNFFYGHVLLYLSVQLNLESCSSIRLQPLALAFSHFVWHRLTLRPLMPSIRSSRCFFPLPSCLFFSLHRFGILSLYNKARRRNKYNINTRQHVQIRL
jgi:hypothetical protein